MNSLAQTMQIIWNQLPSDWRKAALCVIADGHKKQAEDLIAHGSGSSNNAAVQLEYCKYLVLHPHKEASEYVSVYKPLRIIHISSRTEEKDMCKGAPTRGGKWWQSRCWTSICTYDSPLIVGVGSKQIQQNIQNNISHRDHLLALLLGIIGCLLVQWLFIER